MKAYDAFPSKRFSHTDCGTTHPIGTIASAGYEDDGFGNVLIVRFKTDKTRFATPVTPEDRARVIAALGKGWKLSSKPNLDIVVAIAGTDDTDYWTDVEVELFASTFTSGGIQRPFIACKAPKRQKKITRPPDEELDSAPPAPPATPKKPPSVAPDESDDDIVF